MSRIDNAMAASPTAAINMIKKNGISSHIGHGIGVGVGVTVGVIVGVMVGVIVGVTVGVIVGKSVGSSVMPGKTVGSGVMLGITVGMDAINLCSGTEFSLMEALIFPSETGAVKSISDA